METMPTGECGESTVARLRPHLWCLQDHTSSSNLSPIMKLMGQGFPFAMKFSRKVSRSVHGRSAMVGNSHYKNYDLSLERLNYLEKIKKTLFMTSYRGWHVEHEYRKSRLKSTKVESAVK